MLGCIFSLLIYALAIVNRLRINNSIFRFCGRISFEIYLVQGFIIPTNWMNKTFSNGILFLLVALSLDVMLAYMANSAHNMIANRTLSLSRRT
jgi:peptidoglycan/LPS O-acetylase OafA/YrhL